MSKQAVENPPDDLDEELLDSIWDAMELEEDEEEVPVKKKVSTNAFCPTGEGGGRDNSCGGKGGNKGKGTLAERMKNPDSAAFGGRPPKKKELKVFHQTHPNALESMFDSDLIKPMALISKEISEEGYGDTVDGAEYIYTGLHSDASSFASLSHGAMLELDVKEYADRIAVQPEIEMGIAMIHGPISPDAIKGIRFAEQLPANSPLAKRLYKEGFHYWGPEGGWTRKGRKKKIVENVFCPTGEGGGNDPTCSPGKKGAKKGTQVLPIRVDEFKVKGGTPDEISQIYKLAAEQTSLQKQVKLIEGAGATAVETKAKLEAVKTELDGVRQTIRDRYAAEHGREAEKALTMKKAIEMQKKKDGITEPEKVVEKTTKKKEPFGLSMREASSAETLKENAKVPHPTDDTSYLKTHRMTERVQLNEVIVAGVKIRYEPGLEQVVAETMAEASSVHPELWRQNKSLVFVRQEARDTEKWRKEYQLEETSFIAATGGDGHVVVYGGRRMGSDLLSHESAHNLATNVFGNTDPKLSQRYDTQGKAMSTKFKVDSKLGVESRVENAVTSYGQSNRAEDFAEYVAAYNEIYHKGKMFYRQATKQKLDSRPEMLKTIKLLLGDT